MSNTHEHFVVPVKYYVGTFIALLVLTVITVAVAQVDFGPFNLAIALAIAALKAGLVATYFMALKWDRLFVKIIFLSTLIFVTIFIGLTASDIFTRDLTDPVEAGVHNIQTKIKAPTHHDTGDAHH